MKPSRDHSITEWRAQVAAGDTFVSYETWQRYQSGLFDGLHDVISSYAIEHQMMHGCTNEDMAQRTMAAANRAHRILIDGGE